MQSNLQGAATLHDNKPSRGSRWEVLNRAKFKYQSTFMLLFADNIPLFSYFKSLAVFFFPFSMPPPHSRLSSPPFFWLFDIAEPPWGLVREDKEKNRSVYGCQSCFQDPRAGWEMLWPAPLKIKWGPQDVRICSSGNSFDTEGLAGLSPLSPCREALRATMTT